METHSASTGTTAQSAAPVPSTTFVWAPGSSYEFAATDNFTIKKTYEGFALLSANQPVMSVESETLIGLLVKADNERVYGVLNLQDEEMEYIFGRAFLKSRNDAHALSQKLANGTLLTKQ